MNRTGKIAISEIIMLLIGTIAFAYLIGGNIGFVSAANQTAASSFSTALTAYQATARTTSSTPTPTFQAPASGIGDPFTAEYSNMKDVTDVSYADYETAYNAAQDARDAANAITDRDSLQYLGADNKATELEGIANAKEAKAVQDQANANAAGYTSGGLWLDNAISSVSYGLTVYGATYALLAMGGADRKWQQSIPAALGFATTIARFTHTMTWTAGWGTAGVFALAAVVMFLSTYKDERFRAVTFNCYSWKAPTGGDYCNLCNNQGGLPCSDYQCKSLGQSCELLNNEQSKNQLCYWVNKNDVTPPSIKVRADALPNGYTYKPYTAASPLDLGVNITYSGSKDGCIPAFTPLTFGIITIDDVSNREEPAICRVDTERVSFENMRYAFEAPEEYRINHTFRMSLPSLAVLEIENLTLKNNGEMMIYTKCMDKNGNDNKNDFVFRFCVQKEPDTKVPYVVGTNIVNNMPVASGQGSFNFEMYLNEPVTECRWSVDEGREFGQMTVNIMNCSSELKEFNAQMVWGCEANLTGIKDKQENKFYFRCNDTSGNVNTQDLFYDEGGFKIIGTQPLVIDMAGPNGTIRDSREAVKVTLTAKTSAGYKEGLAICSYRETGDETSTFVEFLNTNSYQHSTGLDLPEGDYSYDIRCVDLGNNYDTEKISFDTISDSNPPQVTRVYKEEGYLKIITNEPADCVYNTQGSSYLFEDGIPMTKKEETNHFTDWKTRTKFYIKCRDEYGNEPAPDETSITVVPIE